MKHSPICDTVLLEEIIQAATKCLTHPQLRPELILLILENCRLLQEGVKHHDVED